jgi:hypothetical protein
MAQLTWNDITTLDAILLQGLRHIHHLPKSFPRVACKPPPRNSASTSLPSGKTTRLQRPPPGAESSTTTASWDVLPGTPSLEPPPNTSTGRWPSLSHTVLTPWAGLRPFYPQATSSPQNPRPSGRAAKSQTTSLPPLPRSWTIEAPYSIPNLTLSPTTSYNASPHSRHTGSSRGTT